MTAGPADVRGSLSGSFFHLDTRSLGEETSLSDELIVGKPVSIGETCDQISFHLERRTDDMDESVCLVL